jgi:transcription antitermination factor NusG
MTFPAYQKHWHVVYTKSRAEKKVLIELEYQGIDAYLPLQRKLRQWSDRKKWVEVPLISGYIFVNINRFEYDKVLQTIGVVSYVRFEGKAAIIPEEQIDSIKRLLLQNEHEIKVSIENFMKGDSIEVIAGSLIGMKGSLVTIKGKKRVAILLEQINLSIMVDLPITDIRKV